MDFNATEERLGFIVFSIEHFTILCVSLIVRLCFSPFFSFYTNRIRADNAHEMCLCSISFYQIKKVRVKIEAFFVNVHLTLSFDRKTHQIASRYHLMLLNELSIRFLCTMLFLSPFVLIKLLCLLSYCFRHFATLIRFLFVVVTDSITYINSVYYTQRTLIVKSDFWISNI